MKRNSLLYCFLLALLAFPLLAAAQKSAPVPHCKYTFTSGSGLTFLEFCVTAQGNVLSFTTPQKYTHIISGEGYSLCDETTGKVYYDYAGEGDNNSFLDAAATQPNGPNTLPLTIRRATVDGLFVFTQVFTRNVEEKSVQIKMTVRSMDLAQAHTIYLARVADADLNNSAENSQSLFSHDDQSVFAWDMGDSVPHGLMLYTLTPAVAHQALFTSYTPGLQPNACKINPAVNQTGKIDGVFYLTHHFTLPSPTPGSASGTVKVAYKQF